MGYKFVTLEHLLECEDEKKLIAITLDDAYSDNLMLGLPLFEELKIPVITFVNTFYVTNDVPLWWIQLGENIFEKGKHQGDNENKLIEFFIQRNSFIKNQPKFIENEGNNSRSSNVNGVMTEEQLRVYSESEYVTLGAHTHTHIAVSNMTDKELRTDLKKNISEIYRITKKKPKYFAYPYGSPAEIRNCAKILSTLGLKAALTTEHAFYSPSNDKYLVPRLTIDDKTTARTIFLSQVKPTLRRIVARLNEITNHQL